MDPYPFHFVTQGIIINLLPLKGSLANLTFDWLYIQCSITCSLVISYFLIKSFPSLEGNHWVPNTLVA